ncbi:MAG: diaminopimelate epimerase [Actinobacteria bacterium]|nr:diaminopimelate epimerase [Actinomycetota bacterium]
MSTPLHLCKLHATGNDFLVCDPAETITGWMGSPTAALAGLCNRHTGVGADGLIFLNRGSDGADCTMKLHNADGGRAEMSGNGIRCLAWLAHRKGLGDGKRLVVDTDAGRREVDLDVDPLTDELRAATVDMGPVTFEPSAIPLDAPTAFDLEAVFHGTRYVGDAAGMGNPHLVLIVDDLQAARVTQHGPHLEHDERFPNRTNVEFVAPTAGKPDAIDMRVWERGVGETLSCGTGACAAAAVANRRGLVGERAVVHVPGGDLTVELGETIRLGGSVTHVFDTTVDLDDFKPRRVRPDAR